MENEVTYKVQEKSVALAKFDARIADMERQIETKQILLARLKGERESKVAALQHLEEIDAENQRLVDRFWELDARYKELVAYYDSFEFDPHMPEEHKRKNDPEMPRITAEKLEIVELVKGNVAKSKQVFYGKVRSGGASS